MKVIGNISLFLVLILSGCAAPEIEKEQVKNVNIFWPPPPADPKIKFVEEFSSIEDMGIETKGGWLQNIIAGDKDVSARLIRPYGVAVDADGKIYVADVGRVLVFDKKNGNFLSIGNKPGTVQLKMPIGIAVSADGTMYVSDAASERVFIYRRGGEFIGAIGSAGELKSPAGLAIDAINGRLYVADTKKYVVRAYAFDGNLLFSITGEGGDKGRFNFPTSIAVDSKCNIYVVDTGNSRVQVFDSDGKFIKTIGGGGKHNLFIRPKGIAIDSDGNIYVVDAAAQKFFMFNKEAKLLFSVGKGGSDPGQFSVPAGICVDAGDGIYVVDQLNGRIQVFQYLGEKWKASLSSQKQITHK